MKLSNIFPRNEVTIDKGIHYRSLYHVIITKYSRSAPTTEKELLGVIDYLSNYAKVFVRAFHNNGEYHQLHVHLIIKYNGKYSALKYPGFNIHWQRIEKGNYSIKNLIKYLFHGVSLPYRPFSQEQILVDNYHHISETFLTE